jgi:cytochrome P450
MYALSRYSEVREVLRQPLRFVSSRGVSPIQKVNDILVGSTLNSDPPEHDRTRAVTSEPLLPGALKEIEPMLEQAANGLIDTLCQRGEFDAIANFAQFLPITIVAELVGLPVRRCSNGRRPRSTSSGPRMRAPIRPSKT